MTKCYSLLKYLAIIFLVVGSGTASFAQDKLTKKELKIATAKAKAVDFYNMVEDRQFIFRMSGQIESTFLICGNQVQCNLPFYGSTFFGGGYQSPEGNSTFFKSADFVYEKTNKKDDSWEVSIKVTDKTEMIKLYFHIFDDGVATLRIFSENRSSSKYIGFIEPIGASLMDQCKN